MDENDQNAGNIMTLCSETKYQKIKEMLLASSKKPDKDLKVTFFQPEDTYGWIDVVIKTASQNTTIETSNVYDPYFKFIWWLESVLYNQLSLVWEVDEEERYKESFVYAVDKKHLRFVMIEKENWHQKSWNENLIVIDTVVSKEKFIKAFYLGFKNFVENEYSHDLWEESDLREHLKRLDIVFSERKWDYVYPYDNYSENDCV